MIGLSYEAILEEALREHKIRDRFPTLHWLEEDHMEYAMNVTLRFAQRVDKSPEGAWQRWRLGFMGDTTDLLPIHTLCPCFLIPRPTAILPLFIALHEVGHVANGDPQRGQARNGNAAAEELPNIERKACEWARDFLRRHHVEVPGWVWCSAQAHGGWQDKGSPCTFAEWQEAERNDPTMALMRFLRSAA